MNFILILFDGLVFVGGSQMPKCHFQFAQQTNIHMNSDGGVREGVSVRVTHQNAIENID